MHSTGHSILHVFPGKDARVECRLCNREVIPSTVSFFTAISSPPIQILQIIVAHINSSWHALHVLIGIYWHGANMERRLYRIEVIAGIL